MQANKAKMTKRMKMPYIHWEFQVDQQKRHNMIQAIARNDRYRKKERSSRGQSLELSLLETHINTDQPLHIRRTLDQYFYTSLKSTTARDDDQVVYRYAKNMLDGIATQELPLMMVDQLWLLMLYDGKGEFL